MRAPEVLFELAPQDGLGEAFVMRRIGGTAIARKLLRDAPYATARDEDRGPARRDPGAHPCRRPAATCRRSPIARRPTTSPACAARSTRSSQPQPVFELALSWLDRRRPPPIAQARAGAWRLPHRQLSRRRDRRDRDPRLGGRASRRSGRGSRLAVREELALRRRRQAGRRLRQPRGTVGRLRARRRRQGRSGARALVGGVRHGALGHHLPSPRRGGISRAR